MINAFLLVLVAMIFWTGGSLFMRMELWPAMEVWYHVSIFGLLLLGYALFNFAYEYVDCKKRFYKVFWFTVMLIIDVVNWVHRRFPGAAGEGGRRVHLYRGVAGWSSFLSSAPPSSLTCCLSFWAR